ncbi:MAG: response regulator transcription factor [Anaerolineales bacterium]
MCARILVADDELVYAQLIEQILKLEKHQVELVQNGRAALDVIAQRGFDLVVLDVMMPVMDGITACKRIREFSRVPIILLTAKFDEADIVQGLDAGADDYITKPFLRDEFLARVRAALRRVTDNETQPMAAHFEHGDLRINLTRAEVFFEGKPVYLSTTEYRLLLYFVQHSGQVLSAEHLLGAVWGDEYVEEREILWVTVSRLRQKIERDARQPRHILTKPGKGYLMPKEVR